MSYGAALGVTAPTVSVTVGPTYATQVNAFLAALQTVVEAKVTPAGMDINANLTFLSGGTYYRPTDMSGASFNSTAAGLAAASYASTIYVKSGDLYYNDASSNAVRLTASGAVNVSTTGGITGTGYGATSVEVAWVAGSVAYKMRSGSLTDSFASVWLNDVLLNDGSGNYLTLAAPAMAADYTMTLPNAVPATSNSVLAMATTGAVTATATPTVTTLATTGAATVGSTLGVTGLITATAGVTCAANQDVTVSGTGAFNHGNLLLNISACAGSPNDATTAAFASGSGSVLCNAAAVWSIPIPLKENDVIDQIRFWVNPNGTTARTFRLYSVEGSTGSVTTHETDSSTATATDHYDLVVSPAVTVVEGMMLYASFIAGDGGDGLHGIDVRYSHP